jgi:hypothetical protein
MFALVHDTWRAGGYFFSVITPTWGYGEMDENI